MAATYEIVSSMPVVEIMPPNRTRTVTEVAARAKPSGVVFYLRFPPAAYTTANVRRTVAAVAEGLNKDSEVPGVAGIHIEQDTDASNQLVEYGVVTVESTSGNSQGVIRAVQTWLFLDTFDNKVAALRKKLDDLEDS
jgi:hypothetical protein